MNETWLIQEKYEVISKIKQGGFGIIYYGFDRTFEKPVAIKAVEPSLLQEARYIDMFLEEAKNAAKLNHNNIVHIYDLIKSDDGHFYIIMEYIDGIDLGRLLKKCRAKKLLIPPDLGIYITKEICKALEYAHNKKDFLSSQPLHIVHQDISPSNIMISFQGQVKLIDFGIAKVRFFHNGNEREIILAGKLPYMSPEQLNGAGVDKRSDLFALGSVFYEILTGQRLFDAADDRQVIEAIKKHRPDANMLEQHNIPTAIQKILMKSVQKDIDDRYQGANEIYIDLVEYLMTTSHSVELSRELSEFVHKLFREELAVRKGATVDRTSKEGPQPATLSSEPLPVHEPDAEKQSPPVVIPGDSSSGEASPTPAVEEGDAAVLTKAELEEIKINLETDAVVKPIGDLQPPAAEAGETRSVVREAEKTTAAPPVAPIAGDESAGDEVKTIIDVIRLSGYPYRKYLLRSALGIGAAVALFMILSIAFRLNAFGARAYDYLFPPAIKIYSSPQGAQVYLNDKLLPGKTPLSVSKIKPGVHRLKLTYAGFQPLVKSIHVPSRGDVNVSGEKSRKGQEPYLFRFKTLLELNSDPPGATIILNDTKLNQKTPTSVEWEVGIPLNVRMSKPGYSEIKGLSIDLLEETYNIEDRRLWNFRVVDEPYKTYIIEGMYKKTVRIASFPSEVDFYLNGSDTPAGTTGRTHAIALTLGNHQLRFVKEGLNPKTLDVTITEKGPESIVVTMTRNVRFFAKDAKGPNDNEIGATIARVYRQDQSMVMDDKTPCEIALAPLDYHVLLKKSGYKETVVLISAGDREVVARMEPLIAGIEVKVIDALTALPLKATTITCQAVNNETSGDYYFGVTDNTGKCKNQIDPGQYVFKVKKEGYFEKSAMVNTFETQYVEFKLIIQ